MFCSPDLWHFTHVLSVPHVWVTLRFHKCISTACNVYHSLVNQSCNPLTQQSPYCTLSSQDSDDASIKHFATFIGIIYQDHNVRQCWPQRCFNITLYIRISNIVKGEFLEEQWSSNMAKGMLNPIFRSAQNEEFERDIHDTTENSFDQRLDYPWQRTSIKLITIIWQILTSLSMAHFIGLMTRELNCWELNQRCSSLIVNPIKHVIDKDVEIYKIIVTNALDECSSPWVIESLIKAILNGVTDIPLKFFILSRPEDWIKRTFSHVARSSLLQEFTLHDVAESDVQRDIETYLRSALSDIAMAHGYVHHDPSWPPERKLNTLLIRSDGLFIDCHTLYRCSRCEFPTASNGYCAAWTHLSAAGQHYWQSLPNDHGPSVWHAWRSWMYFEAGGTYLGCALPNTTVYGWHHVLAWHAR